MALKFKPICFDSIGAKSSCTLVETSDIKVLIDPGVTVMQPSFPASSQQKEQWKKQGLKSIRKAAQDAEIIVVSHYHYDHFLPDKRDIYEGKKLFTKNPNEYINDSQRQRAENFFKTLIKNSDITINERQEQSKSIGDYPESLLNFLPVSNNKDFGDYQKRRNELMKKGKRRYKRKKAKWIKRNKILPLDKNNIKIVYPENQVFKFEDTVLRFTGPLFHGIEYSKVGWVFSTVIEHNGKKFLHSSDLNGPIIEDYAEWIIKENPDYLILDGPMTYMYGFLLNKINLGRAVDNACKIIKNIDSDVIIYDHHLVREKNFRKHTKKAWDTAYKKNVDLLTAAEYLDYETIVEKIT
ncbi:MAG: MBL fold metallo-hydrolase [Candidatus Thermoplasmatota archaeon]